MAVYTAGANYTAPYDSVKLAADALAVLVHALDSTTQKVLGTAILRQGSKFIGYVIYGA